MKKYFRKGIIYLIAMGLILPTWLLGGLVTASRVEAEEILLNPIVTEISVSGPNDWVEVYNPNSDATLNMSGYKLHFESLTRDDDYTFNSLTVGPKQVRIFSNNYFTPLLNLSDDHSWFARKVEIIKPNGEELQPDANYGGGTSNHPTSTKSLQFNPNTDQWFTATHTYAEYDPNRASINIALEPNQAVYNDEYTITVDFQNAVVKKYELVKDGISGGWREYTGHFHASDEGNYIVNAYAENGLGQVTTDSTDFSIDKTKPVVTVNSSITKNIKPEITGTIDDPAASIKVNIAGHNYSAVNNGDGTWILAEGALVCELADGTYDVAATATDLAGNGSSDSTTNELVIDTTAPQITSPVDGQSTGENVKINFSDLNLETATLNGEAVTSGAEISAEGGYTVVVTDKAGNISTIQFAIDRTAPVLQVSGENGTLVFKGSLYEVPTVNAVDNIDGAFSNTSGEKPVIEISGSVDTSLLGDQSLTFKAIDKAGNVSAETKRVFTVIDPISFDAKQTNSSSSIDVTWTGVGAVDAYEVYINGILAKSIPSQNISGDLGSSYSTQISVSTFGKYTVLVKAVKGKAQTTNTDVKIAELVAPPAPAPVATPASPAAPAKVKAAAPVAPAPAESSTPSDDNGKIKGDETNSNSSSADSEDKVNWTPWIVLFILILLAGAATGGYFYWFNGEEDEEIKTIVKESKVTEVKKKPVAPPASTSSNSAKKKNSKKQKRW